VEELTSLLALERANKQAAQTSLAALTVTLESAQKERARLQGMIDTSNAQAAGAGGQAAAMQSALDQEKQISARAASQIDILNQQIAALRRQLAAIEEALSASEGKDKEAQAKIADLGSRLNVALAQKVQELARYRSDFFGRLREILGDKPGIKVAGDRFVFQSEVLFESGQAAINPAGHAELDQLAAAIITLEREIPPEIAWVLRVDGHTDQRPIKSTQYPSNWDLSAARAIAVVQYLAGRGVDPHRLVAAGFGEYQPVEPGDTDEAMRKNRRIELKLTER
jgi:chemotaxis protein MotB